MAVGDQKAEQFEGFRAQMNHGSIGTAQLDTIRIQNESRKKEHQTPHDLRRGWTRKIERGRPTRQPAFAQSGMRMVKPPRLFCRAARISEKFQKIAALRHPAVRTLARMRIIN
nr:hypothetical protein [Shinella curvata]